MSSDNMDKRPDTDRPDRIPDDRLDEYGPEIDGEPGGTHLPDTLSERDDDLLRQLSLSMDDRLGLDEETRLRALIDEGGSAADIEGDLMRARTMLHEVAIPTIPEGLLERTLSRVSEASIGAGSSKGPGDSQDVGRILFLARSLALAAAILLVGSLFAYSNHDGQVKAAPPTQTVEDRLDEGLLDYLKLRFLGRSKSTAAPSSGSSVEDGTAAGTEGQG